MNAISDRMYKRLFSEASVIINTMPRMKKGGKAWKRNKNRLNAISTELNNAKTE